MTVNPTESTPPEPTKSFSGKGVFPHRWAFTLLIPLRNIFLSPKRLIDRLEIKRDATVLEIGPGPGYFSVPLARFLTGGKLVLADIQQEMLDHAKRRLTKRGLDNVEYYRCIGSGFDLPDANFDAIFMVTVLGEVSDKDGYLRECHRMLKPGGVLSISEQAGDPDKLSTAEVRELAESAGFVYDKMYGKERNYTINFKKS